MDQSTNPVPDFFNCISWHGRKPSLPEWSENDRYDSTSKISNFGGDILPESADRSSLGAASVEVGKRAKASESERVAGNEQGANGHVAVSKKVQKSYTYVE